MASLLELAHFRTDLEAPEVEHLQRLVGEWGLLADLCFADLLLWVRTAQDPDLMLVLAQIRPITGQTIYRRDWTGLEVPASERPLLGRCFSSGQAVEGEIDHRGLHERVSVLCVPVRCRSRQIAVITRESAPSLGRQQGELEVTYAALFDRFASMLAAGAFPYLDEDRRVDLMPRVGDGVMVLDETGMVVFTSPNAVSALVRIGVVGNPEGRRMAELGLDEGVVRRAFASKVPATTETEGGDAAVVVRVLPMLESGELTGAIVMLRDVTELRWRDRLLVSKDATIREIHHRVKNNLQTISSLLRLQGRRLTSSEAKAAVEESVRRIRSIALVHETLSREAGEDVSTLEVVGPLVKMVEEGYSSRERPLHFKVRGDAGKLPAAQATPLAVVLTELLQNVVDHAYPVGEEESPGEALVELENDGTRLVVRVIDDGVGVPAGFSVEGATGLGLQIVRTLVETDLGGTLDISSAGGPPGRPGTIVELEVPLVGSDRA